MNQSIQLLRNLAATYVKLASEDRNTSLIKLHKNVNDLKMTRPVVLINELPWAEMNIDNQLTLICEDPVLRAAEDWLRKKIFQYRNFPADMILTPYLPVRKVIHTTSIGVSVDEDTIEVGDGNHIAAHEYHDQLATEEAIDKIVLPTITYDETETKRRYELLSNTFGDILPVRVKGTDYLGVVTWDDISRYRGVTPLLMDLIDRPELTHKMVRKLTDVHVHTLSEYERLGLFDDEPLDLHCTPVATDDLNPSEDSPVVTRKNIWGRGAAQILASVSGEMRREFDIAYMKETVGQCGLVYYGCCEPLDKMIDVVEEIPNLRKISVTPWADVDIAADAIGSKYVISSKPNPASVAVDHLNEDALRKEIRRILDAGKRNGSHMDIVLKDISSCHHNPKNIFRWEQIVMEMVNTY